MEKLYTAMTDYAGQYTPLIYSFLVFKLYFDIITTQKGNMTKQYIILIDFIRGIYLSSNQEVRNFVGRTYFQYSVVKSRIGRSGIYYMSILYLSNFFFISPRKHLTKSYLHFLLSLIEDSPKKSTACGCQRRKEQIPKLRQHFLFSLNSQRKKNRNIKLKCNIF